MSGVYDFVPSAADLDRWRLQTQFTSGDVEQIASVSRTIVSRWFDSHLFHRGETFRIDAGPSSVASLGHRRFTRFGLIRVFREFKMRQALINIGEVSSCYAFYLGSDVSSCRSMLSASSRDLIAPADLFDLGQSLHRHRPIAVIADFTDDESEPYAHAMLIELCRSILTTSAITANDRPVVIGFGIPSRDAGAVDIPIANADDLYMAVTKLCGQRLSV